MTPPVTAQGDNSYRVVVDIPCDAARIERRIGFSMGGIGADVADAVFRVSRARQKAGGVLYRFAARLRLHDGRPIEVQETLPDLDLAAERALSRSVRAVRRALRPARVGFRTD